MKDSQDELIIHISILVYLYSEILSSINCPVEYCKLLTSVKGKVKQKSKRFNSI